MIACFWVIIGFVSYIRNRHFISCIAFILAIASRQYMLAFPIAITTYEFMIAVKNIRNLDTIKTKIINLFKWRWIAPFIAALSIFAWIYLFQGLVPKTALEVRLAPEVQRSTSNFGILPDLGVKIKNKRERYGKYRDRSLEQLAGISEQLTVSSEQLAVSS